MSHSVDDYYQTYQVRLRRSRTKRACMACGETIRVGDRYANVFIVEEDGDTDTVVRCLRCQEIHRAVRRAWRSQGVHDMWPDERLNCGETWEDEHDGAPPPDVARLAFLTADEAQRELTDTKEPQ